MKSDQFVNLVCPHPNLVLFADDVVALVPYQTVASHVQNAAEGQTVRMRGMRAGKRVRLLWSGEALIMSDSGDDESGC